MPSTEFFNFIDMAKLSELLIQLNKILVKISQNLEFELINPLIKITKIDRQGKLP